MTTQEFKAKATALIDDLKGVCANYGLANDGNEFKIITQVFLSTSCARLCGAPVRGSVVTSIPPIQHSLL